jgi:uncharacterized RDD family membrane protein YckC
MTEQTQVVYASVTRRALALVIDAAIFAVFLMTVEAIIPDVRTQSLTYQISCPLYFIVLESTNAKASLGKWLMKIYVAMDDGGRASVARIAARCLLFNLPALPFIWFSLTPAYTDFLKTLQMLNNAADQRGVMDYLRSPDGHRVLVESYMFVMVYIAAGAVLLWLPSVVTRQKTGLHDFLTHTRVFRREPPREA